MAMTRNTTGKEVHITKEFSLRPLRRGIHWYIEHAVVSVHDPMLKRWRAHRKKFVEGMDENRNPTFRSHKVCEVTIRSFVEKCEEKGWRQ